MRRLDATLALRVAAVCAPTLVAVATGLYFLVVQVPEIQRKEPQRIKGEYAEIQNGLRSGERKPDIVWKKAARGNEVKYSGAAEAWEALGAIPTNMTWATWYGAEAESKRKQTEGIYDPSNGWVAVWCRIDAPGDSAGRFNELRGAVMPRPKAVEYEKILWPGGAFVLVVLVLITLWGVRYFIGYARARDDFLAATAHDLTTPLVGLRYVIGRDDAEARNLNERMIRIVGNIRDFLRLGGRRPPAPERIDLRAAFAEAYGIFAADYAEEVSGPVATEGPDALYAMADPTMTVQILWNLLGNDLKYAAPYGRVTARFRARDGFAEVALADEGPGMDARQRRRAFDRYYRAKTVLETGKGGFGIGLCTAREFARSMGGELTVGPNGEKGCVFTLTLPND